MAYKPCRWLNPKSEFECGKWVDGCGHPLLDWLSEDIPAMCHGCPCHEPQPDPTPDTCRWWRDEYTNWCCGCSDTMPDFTPWPATDPNGWHCPKCGKLIEHDPTPTGGKTGHDKP